MQTDKMKNINNYIEFKIKNQTNMVKGLLLSFTDEWSLLLNNPVDYVCDGYLLIRNSQIINHRISSSITLATRILRKKNKKSKFLRMNIETSKLIFENLFKEEVVFSISNVKKNSFLIGKIIKIFDTEFDFRVLSPKAKWGNSKKIKFENADIIEWNSDYINSLLLEAENFTCFIDQRL